MRSYPRNSPEAAARIVALVLIADGHVCRSELEALQHLQIDEELGLPAGGFHRVVQNLCEDQMLDAYHGGPMVGQIDRQQLAGFMADVEDPDLQRTVLRLACAAAQADRHLADAERIVLEAAVRQWERCDPPAGGAHAARVEPPGGGSGATAAPSTPTGAPHPPRLQAA